MIAILMSVTLALHTCSSSLAFISVLQPVGRWRLRNASSRQRNISLSLLATVPIDLDSIEIKAQESSESWEVYVTPFLSEADADRLEDRFEKRADVKYIKVGGFPGSSRTRFVMTNPDLELDQEENDAEHCVTLCIDHISSAQIPQSSSRLKPWPGIVMGIGVDLHNVGDVILEDGNAYMVVVPEVVRQCSRLLPKELKGVGITVTKLEPGEYVPYDGVQQDMELGELNKRALKYK